MYKIGRDRVVVIKRSRFKSVFVRFETGRKKGGCAWVSEDKLTKVEA